jgi:putative nucleotidyltransferase with HDIG domain
MSKLARQVGEVNRELWLLLSLFVVTGLLNYLIASHRMVLGFYALPTLFAAYLWGRRHAVLTAVASVLLVVLVTYFNPFVFTEAQSVGHAKWYDITVWGGVLLVTAFAMGTLHERSEARLRDLRQTYYGVLMILRQFISKDKYTENHCYRVSIYATKIAAQMGLDSERIEDVRAAALLHDIGKLDVSREILYKAAQLTHEEYEEVRGHVKKGVVMLEPVGGSLRRILPIILAHHDRYDGTGYNPTVAEDIPLEGRILALADAYDAITSDRPYRKASTPFEAKEIIENLSGKNFDPEVVAAFLAVFRRQDMEVPGFVV